MERSQSEQLGKLKKIRRISLIAFTVIAIGILFLIQYAGTHVQWQSTVTNIVRVFIVLSLADAGYNYYLNKKIRALQQHESSGQ